MNTANTQPTTPTRTQGSKEKLKGEKRVLKKLRRVSTPSGGPAMGEVMPNVV